MNLFYYNQICIELMKLKVEQKATPVEQGVILMGQEATLVGCPTEVLFVRVNPGIK